jgi:ABC-type Fe3+ transport system substrate-binding protein
MAQTILQEVEAGALKAIAAAVTSNSAVVEAYIASGESAVLAGLTNLLKNIPSVKGALALVVGPLETAVEAGVEAYAAKLVAQYTPAQLTQLLVQFLTALAAKV